MSAWGSCRDGDCDPYSCPVCAQACEACDELECTCPTISLDEDDES